MRFALSSSLRRVAVIRRPERLIWNWIIRIADPIPLGLTRLEAIVRAIVSASRVNRSSGGEVETVFTRRSQLFFFVLPVVLVMKATTSLRERPRNDLGVEEPWVGQVFEGIREEPIERSEPAKGVAIQHILAPIAPGG